MTAELLREQYIDYYHTVLYWIVDNNPQFSTLIQKLDPNITITEVADSKYIVSIGNYTLMLIYDGTYTKAICDTYKHIEMQIEHEISDGYRDFLREVDASATAVTKLCPEYMLTPQYITNWISNIQALLSTSDYASWLVGEISFSLQHMVNRTKIL